MRRSVRTRSSERSARSNKSAKRLRTASSSRMRLTTSCPRSERGHSERSENFLLFQIRMLTRSKHRGGIRLRFELGGQIESDLASMEASVLDKDLVGSRSGNNHPG